ncbi:MAG: hypothetical protein K2K44_00930 [Oscillospiraceae bacterium]|nr:hypothetical protein [Oscillospiraceae bacterium]
MFCPKCGKELTEGEPCSCGYSQDSERQNSSLPDGKAILDGAKNAAEAIKNNPYVSEVLSTITGAAANPEKQIKDNSERTDILWVIMAVLEAVVTSLGTAMYVNKIVSEAFKAASMGFFRLDVPKGLFFKVFGAAFLWSAICIFALILIYMLFMKICKKQVGFSAAANTMTTALLPSSIMVLAAGILGLAYMPIGIIFISAALISLVALCYSLVRNIGGTKFPAFWLFVIFAAVSAAVCALAGNICMKMFVEGLSDLF